jgi:RNA-dependent RNA polymerase
MGILDEYKVLKENEVFISFQEEKDKAVKVVSGRVIVTRNPCLHPGDIQIL